MTCGRNNVGAMKSWLAGLFLLWSCTASTAAPRCAPFQDDGRMVGQVLAASVSDPAGPYLVWGCASHPEDTTQPVTVTYHCIEAPWSAITLRNLGDRADTVRNAADPVAAFFASHRRHVTSTSARCAALLKAL